MLELIELRFKMIGRFVDEQVIYVDKLGNFVQIDGQNNNTKGSSGSGKSTIFKALDYLLGLKGTPATVLQSRKIINPEEEPIWVQGIFLLDNERLVMTRSVSKFTIDDMGGIKKGTAAEEELVKILGMPGDLFRKIIHKRQKEGGFFMDLTAGQMHDFLMDCCNLSPFKKKYEIIEAKIKELEGKRVNADGDLKMAQSSLGIAQDSILALGLAPIKDMHEEVVKELEEKFKRSAIRFTDVQSQHEALEREQAKNRPSTSNPAYDDSARETLEKRRIEIEASIRTCLEEEKLRQDNIRQQLSEALQRRIRITQRIEQGSAAKEMATRLAAEIKSIRSSKCPTCTQDWATESSAAIEQGKLAEIAALRQIIVDSTNAWEERILLESSISAFQNSLSPIVNPQLPVLNSELLLVTAKIIEEKRKAGELYEQQNAVTKAKLDSFVEAQNHLRATHRIEIEQVRGQMDVDRRVYESAMQKLRTYEEAKIRFDQTHNELTKRAENFEKNTIKYRSELESIVKEQNLAYETEKAIKMYVSFSFDEALDAISEKATKIIRCIPNTSNATIQFEGTKETQKGTVKEEVNAVLSVDGEIGVPIKSLSGGERTSTDLAVDLAVIDYIETKTGKGLNIFIIDEPFDGLGTVEIEMALEVFKNANINKKLIIVDHNPEVKQMVQDRLVVVRDGLTSKVS